MVTIACPCPALPGGEPRHESDEITLKPRLGFVEAESVVNRVQIRAIQQDEDLELDEITAVLTEGYILHGVESWTLVGDDGKPLPVTKGNIRARILDDWEIATEVATAADALYAKVVMHPLLKTASTSSPDMPTADSTSANPPSGEPAPKPSKPSSISTIPTADIATTSESLAGDSKSSQRSTSAA